VEDDFEVRKGDTSFAGDIDMELELDDLPDDAKVGDTIQVRVDTNMKNKGTCELALTWPVLGGTAAETKTPDGSGRCTWSIPVPTGITKKGTATFVVTIRKDSKYRSVTKEIDIRV
jgi:hypothetical protein